METSSVKLIEAFVDPFYRGKDDHPYRVAAMAIDPDTYVVALLHDVVEDRLATVEELEPFCTPAQLRDILALTRDKDCETYDEYINRVISTGSPIARAVKTFDLMDHLSPYLIRNIRPIKVQRYIKALSDLSLASCASEEEM